MIPTQSMSAKAGHSNHSVKQYNLRKITHPKTPICHHLHE